MRFRTASIAVVVLAASLVMADDKLDESKAIEQIELLGGSVIRDAKLPDRPVIGVHLHRSKQFNDNHMALLIAFPNLIRLTLNSQITDVGVKELRQHLKLTQLELSSSQITDVGLIELRELKELTDLGLNHTRITDAGLRELRGFKNLTALLLARHKTPSAGLIINAGLITDAGLAELKDLKNLKDLAARGERCCL
jgi:internalin A